MTNPYKNNDTNETCTESKNKHTAENERKVGAKVQSIRNEFA